MADAAGYFDYEDDEAADVAAEGSGAQRLVNLAGALVSMALVIGMGIWGYKLLVRDVSGIPVIEALDGAFRTEPEEPGGMQAPHQGLQVNEIAAVGAASGPVDEIRLAPEPDPLAEEDLPWGDLLDTPEKAPDQAVMARLDADGRTEAAPVEIDDQPEDALATDLAVAEAMAALTGETGAEAADPAPLASGALGAPRPLPRPEDEPVEVAARSGQVGAGEIAPSELEKGTRLVQLGAFETADAARDQWSSIGARFTDNFADKRMVVQQATSGGRTFFRLRAEGFTDLADARRFCSALIADQADCIPVEMR